MPERREDQGDRLPTMVHGFRSNIYWGMLGLITVEVAVFSTLIVSYFYLMVRGEGMWPPTSEPPGLLLPTINTFVLFASSAAIHMADKAVRVDELRKMRLGLMVSVVLAVTFLGIKVAELAEKPYQWDTHAYGSMVWTMLGLHSLHVFSVMLKSVVVTVLAFRGYFSSRWYRGMEVNGLYWHFVVLIWLPLYFVIYLTPRFG